MNKTLWKLGRISDKLWLIASSIAMEACKWGTDGRNFAVVADETRNVAEKISSLVESSLFENEDIKQGVIEDMVTQLSYLTINVAIEAQRSGQRGKAVAICAEDTRNLVFELIELVDGKKQFDHTPPPYSAKVMSSIDNKVCFMKFTIDGYEIIENLNFIQEVVSNKIEHDKTHVMLRGSNIPIIDCFSLLGKQKDDAFYVILRTPWAKKNEIYAVAIDELGVNAIFYSSVGIPFTPDKSMALSEYVRECWEAADSEPFRFMNWPAMVKK